MPGSPSPSRNAGQPSQPARGTTLGLVGLVFLLATILIAVTLATLKVLIEPMPERANAAEGPQLLGPAPLPTCAGRTAAPQHELRGMWLTTVGNRDWPSKPGLDPETIKQEYRGWLDVAQKMNHNAVFVHVRPSGDAFWPSEFAPWSQWLTGRIDGQSPGWDPMAFMVAETHARNMEFHAWFNPYKAGQAATVEELAPNHPIRQHPDWAVSYPQGSKSARVYYNPGIPEARKYVEDSILEPVAKYDIDGVHFDDFFYPYPAPKKDFPDQAAYAQYGNGADKGDWRRQNVNQFVQEMSQRIKEIKPWVKFGISPFGIWRNQQTDPEGSATRGLQSYDAIYADTRLWVRKGWLDYVVPQLYWHIGFDVADYAKLLPWWSSLVKDTSVQLYIGQADYRVGEKGPWGDPAQLERQLALNTKYGVSGSIHFSAKHVRDDKLGSVSRYRKAHYNGPALVPAMRQLPGTRPSPPMVNVALRGDAGAVTLGWTTGAGAVAARHAVYRADLTGAEAPQLIGVVPGGTGRHSFVDRAAVANHRYAYCITGLDRLWNEGPASLAQYVA